MRAKDSRNARIRKLKEQGMPNAELARKFGITMARISQILKAQEAKVCQ